VIRAVTQDELEAFTAAAHAAFHEDGHPLDVALDLQLLEPDRTLAVIEDGRMVATAATLTRELTIPGGVLPAAAVTGVGVVPGNTRRGHMRAMMRRQLDDFHEAGERVAALWASEGSLYARFGYGAATFAASYEVHLWRARLERPSADRVQVAEPAAALDHLRAVYEAVRPQVPGLMSREGAWWPRRLHDPEHRRDGASSLRAAIVEDGYALYAPKIGWDDAGPSGEITLRELVAATPRARAALWTYLLRLDLMRTLAWRLGSDGEPLPLMLADADAMQVRTGIGLWIRLVDLPAALAARAYSQPFELVLEVADEFCPWNAGRYRLTSDGTCVPTRADADLALGAAELGAAYLGGTRLTALAAAGRVEERRPGALAVADAAFRGAVAPWCPEIF
jgi:predicted acetyltransferase